MYFLSEDDKRYVLRKLAPLARRNEVAGELRGWNWQQPPLAPVSEARLSVSEVVGDCDTGRDVYLRRVLGDRRPPNGMILEGNALHAALAHLVVRAKQILYCEAPGELRRLSEPDYSFGSQRDFHGETSEESKAKVAALWEFEYHRIVARVHEALARQPNIGPDALVAQALPVIVEHKLDGSYLGLSSRLSADAFVFTAPMIVDVKFGVKQESDRLSTTGHALVMESLFEFPIDIGCVAYVWFKDGRVVLERDFHLIDDELRQWFIDARDERMRSVSEEIDPGKPEECLAHCVYQASCNGRAN